MSLAELKSPLTMGAFLQGGGRDSKSPFNAPEGVLPLRFTHQGQVARGTRLNAKRAHISRARFLLAGRAGFEPAAEV
jgi:hypothetical protein